MKWIGLFLLGLLASLIGLASGFIQAKGGDTMLLSLLNGAVCWAIATWGTHRPSRPEADHA